ncbi:MAG: ThiF family adenylyltransferase [Candidatus Thorarchaeota archaeon]|jgi:hypothetical protein
MPDNVYLRQTDLFDPSKHQERIIILGAGQTGSFTAFGLAKLGVKNIEIWDADAVEPHNCPNQLHRWSDLGDAKVRATSKIIHSFCDGMDEEPPNIVARDEMYEGQAPLKGLVICAADSMEARTLFWEKVKMNLMVPLYIDPRLGGQSLHLYCMVPHDPDHIKIYEGSLYTDEEGDEIPCGSRATSDMGFLIAARIVRAVRRFLACGIVEPLLVEDASTMTAVLGAGTETR